MFGWADAFVDGVSRFDRVCPVSSSAAGAPLEGGALRFFVLARGRLSGRLGSGRGRGSRSGVSLQIGLRAARSAVGRPRVRIADGASVAPDRRRPGGGPVGDLEVARAPGRELARLVGQSVQWVCIAGSALVKSSSRHFLTPPVGRTGSVSSLFMAASYPRSAASTASSSCSRLARLSAASRRLRRSAAISRRWLSETDPAATASGQEARRLRLRCGVGDSRAVWRRSWRHRFLPVKWPNEVSAVVAGRWTRSPFRRLLGP